MASPHRPTICVCICTYQRPELLRRTLAALARQETRGQFTYSIVVADNDVHQSACDAVAAFRAASPVATVYCVEPTQNVALARNKALANASGDYVALIDDDEFPTRDWLAALLAACQAHGADGVLGPVRAHFDQPPPRWLVRGGFCERPEHPTGLSLHWRQTRTGNVLFRRALLAGMANPFRPEFGNGGEDQDFFRRMMQRGYRFIWCQEAIVYEVVPPARWTRTYLLKRALLRGQNERPFLRAPSIAKSVVAVCVYAFLLPFLLPLGHHRFMSYSVRLLDHAGKLLAALGYRPLGDKYLA
jgi:succinoglycan biosynthesis protein ExoM